MLEEDAPADVGDLHAVCVPLADGRLAVCAAERSELADFASTFLTLTPESLPSFLEGKAEPGHFNLLVGEFEPRPLRVARTKRHAFAAATALLCGLLVGVGLSRRAEHWNALAESARAAAAQLAATASPTGKPDDLAAEARRLRGAHDALAKAAAPPDAALSLAAVLHAWPANLPSKPQSVSISPGVTTISVAVEGDAAAFLRSFEPPAGWTLDEPRLNSTDSVTRLSLQLRRTEGKP